MKSSSQHSFAVAPQVSIPRSSFKRNHTYKTTFNAGYLVPIFLDEVIPGDTFNLRLTSFMRILSPLKYPIMDNLYADFQFFFVPIRLVYSDYEKFFGSSAGPENNWQFDDSHILPSVFSPSGGFTAGSLADYFGLPIGVELQVQSLPFRAYNLIINDWYRPSCYELTPAHFDASAGGDLITDYPLQKRMKRADYFTAALPAPQRGNGVEIALGDYAPVIGNGTALGLTDGSSFAGLFGRDATGSNNISSDTSLFEADVGASIGGTWSPLTSKKALGVSTDGSTSGLVADLAHAKAASINSLRQAFQLQRALERDMRGGVRYVSQLLSHFGVRSPDARLQRSEYLGGGSVPIQIHTVANTNGASGSTQASLAAYGVAGNSSVGFVKSFTEHGYIIGLVSVRADLTYQQGVPRLFDRWARFDFYYPVFANLGEQIIKNKEIFAQGLSVFDADHVNLIDDLPFGYQERFAEYRYGVSKITGQLRSTYSTPLDSWHLAQKFNNLPTLSDQFLYEDVPMSRVKADTLAPDFLYDSLVQVNCVRPMPLYGVPGLDTHF